jgi:PPOX class probable F420-dependent enzyme
MSSQLETALVRSLNPRLPKHPFDPRSAFRRSHSDNRARKIAMAEIPADYLGLLTEKKSFAHLATLQPDGSPQVTPVWFDYSNGVVRVNTAKGRIKARNMSVGAKVALSIIDPDNAYRYIQLRGTVTKETTDAGNAHINSLAKKYLGKDVYPWHREGDVRVTYEITPSAANAMG